MNTRITNQAGNRPRAFSADFTRLLGERGLLKLVLDAVQRVDLPPAGAFEKATGFRPQMMLTLTTYCYASCLYGSRDIELAMDSDPTVRYICARIFPDWQSIRRFRRRNRDWIRQCLAFITKQVWALKFDQGEADYVGYEWFETALLDEINVAVNERLDTAALMDGADSD